MKGTAPVEIERQYVLRGTEPALPATIAGFTLAGHEERTIRDAYLDSPDGGLRHAGALLRIRDQDGTRLATYKGGGTLDEHGTRSRSEIEEPLTGPPEEHRAFAAARRHTTEPLVEVGVLENRRSAFHYGGPAGEVEVVVDRLTYPDGSTERRLEAEGPAAAVRELCVALEELVPGLEPAHTTKGEELARRQRAARS